MNLLIIWYNTVVHCYEPRHANKESTAQSVIPREMELNENADNIYRKYLRGEENLSRWLDSRNFAIKEMSGNVTQSELNKWKVVIDSKNSKDLSQKIDMKGEIHTSKVNEDLPSLESLAQSFKSKSRNSNNEEHFDINLPNNNYVEVLDKPIDTGYCTWKAVKLLS